ncbi:conserved hypothetical protein [Vibrio owensii]|jgi:hypothetical protein|uniref:Uncharacterized protein n=1 Tax=Vibrio jasicida TaxID=766224 RepID=A0AAU9QM67_9VIBR|nr:hypothetical protein SN11_24485 [Vibrio harveyi]NOJ20273.1 hypothetical protein [Vibrio jasicida]PAW10449.1 hypothetical protein B6K85_11980 [Vibrio sp. V1B]PMO44894.1 hypothetical protein BCT11_07250 [Vibrio sp. 10N.222.52.B12]CAH1519872.1 conserved hypothetical protein [Vibrio owensii]
MSSRNLSELINTTLLLHSEKLSNLDRDMLTGLRDQLNREQALSDKQVKLCQRLLRKTNQTCVFIHDVPNES